MTNSRIVMHIDFDYFFAQIEEREDPSIKDKPVVVCVYSGRREDSGVVSTANYIAREYGVKSGMPITLAKRKLRDVESVFLPVNHSLYETVSERIMNTVRSFADQFEQVGIDEAFLDVTERLNGNFEKSAELANAVREAIFLKEGISCSIGIGPNKIVAKIAAGRKKPNGLTIVRPDEVQQFLSSLSVRELVGVGRKTEKVLHSLGIRTIGDLTDYKIENLIEALGSSLGTFLHNVALGIDESPVKEKAGVNSISRMVTLKEDTRDLEMIMNQIDRLTVDVYSSVTEQHLDFRSATVLVVLSDLRMRSRTRTFENPIEKLEVVQKTTRHLLEQVLEVESHSFRRVGIKLSNFLKKQGQKRLTDFDS